MLLTESCFKDKKVYWEYMRQLSHYKNNFSSEVSVWLHDVLSAHFLIVDYFGSGILKSVVWKGIGWYGPRDDSLLESAVSRQITSFSWVEKWNWPFEKCATLLFWLVMNHPFYDANKRTAVLISLYLLREKLSYIPTSQKVIEEQLEGILENLASNSLEKYQKYQVLKEKWIQDPEIYFIAEFLRKNFRKIDYSGRVVSLRDVDRAIRRYWFWLDNPSGGSIMVVRIYNEKSLLWFWPIIEKTKKIWSVPFKNWRHKIWPAGIAQIRNFTGLIPVNWIDSKALFEDGEILKELITSYSDLLKRLANK